MSLKKIMQKGGIMSINNVSNLGASYSFCTQNKLSDETKRKLQALGIDYTNVASEAQAQLLIQSAQSRQQIQKTDNNNQQTTCSSELELISRAKTLASKVGISISQNASMSDILTSLSNKITNLTTKSSETINKNNEIEQYRTELTTLENEYSNLTQSQNSIFSAMNISANLNKFMLGLN